MSTVTDAINAKKEKVKLDFKPHAAQQEIAEAALKYKYLVIRAGRRFGKSALCLNLGFREAFNNPGRYWIIAPEYTQAKSIYWRDLVDQYIPKPLIVKKNDQELILEIMTKVPGKTSIIEFKGSDREDKLRGAGLRGVVLDEYAFQKGSVWDKIIGPMLIQTDGWAIFITTPNGVSNHFKKFWDDALAQEAEQNSERAYDTYKAEIELANSENKSSLQKVSQAGFEAWKHRWKTFHFTSYDNPTIKPENLEAERRRLTEEFFTQEYLAEFAKFTGLIFTSFDEKVHVQDFEINEKWTFYRAIDFGATDPNAVVFVGIDKDDVAYFFDEIYINEIHTSELAELIKQKSAHRYYTGTYADSSGKQLIMDLSQYGVFATPVKKNSGENSRNWIVAGINGLQQRFKDQKIVIHPRCKALIKEIMSYSWRKDRLGEAVNLPEDRNNHLIDSTRYLFASYKGGSDLEEDYNYLKRGPSDPFTGY